MTAYFALRESATVEHIQTKIHPHIMTCTDEPAPQNICRGISGAVEGRPGDERVELTKVRQASWLILRHKWRLVRGSEAFVEGLTRGRVKPRVGQLLDLLGVVEIRVGDLVGCGNERGGGVGGTAVIRSPGLPHPLWNIQLVHVHKPLVLQKTNLDFGSERSWMHVYSCNISPHLPRLRRYFGGGGSCNCGGQCDRGPALIYREAKLPCIAAAVYECQQGVLWLRS